MKIAHNITVTVFSKKEDDRELIKGSLVGLFPFDPEKEKVAVEEHAATGFNDRKISVISAAIKKTSHTNAFISRLRDMLGSGQSRRISEEAETRVDEELHFFIRLDKEAWAKDKKAVLTDKGSCFHIRMALAVFPKRREKAVEMVREIFSIQKPSHNSP